MAKCASCGKVATTYNAQKQPVCSEHKKAKIASPNCPDCGLPMVCREGKYGSFWGCMAFPACSGIKKI